MNAEIETVAKAPSRRGPANVCPAPSLRIPVTTRNRGLLRRLRTAELSAWEAGRPCRRESFSAHNPMPSETVIPESSPVTLMKKTGILTLGLLLTILAMSGYPAAAASTSELLQQGLYAEEVEGNMNAAIKTYDQVIKNSSAPGNQVAQALYRQGLCYLKIKDETSARTVLESW